MFNIGAEIMNYKSKVKASNLTEMKNDNIMDAKSKTCIF